EMVFTPEDQEITNLLPDAIKYEAVYQEYNNPYQVTRSSDERMLTIPPMIADELLTKFGQELIRFEMEGEVFNHMEIHHTELPFSVKLDTGRADEFQLDLTAFQSFRYIDLYGYLILDNHFYKISEEQQLLIKELKKLIDQSRNPILPIANDQIEPFVSQVVP